MPARSPRTAALILVLIAAAPAAAQPQTELDVLRAFDEDEDGRLDADERAKARAFVRAEREAAGGRGAGGRRPGRGGRGPGGGPGRGADAEAAPVPGERVAPSDVPAISGDLYDPSVLRTVFLDFANPDWEAELNDFYRTDVEVPALMTVDGATYEGVGVSFRGNSSFFTVPGGRKRSFNISIDAADRGARLQGYRTINLLNLHADASLVREVLFAYVANHAAPAPRANYVRVVINGESWGIYANVQQINNDFVREMLGAAATARWKVPARRSGGGTLEFRGPDRAAYADSYMLKSGDPDAAWSALIDLCDRLERTPAAEVESLDEILALDATLRFLAVENVFIDCDGYVSRGSDYTLLIDEHGRFRPQLYDGNETFRYPGGGPGFPGDVPRQATMSPLLYDDEPARPLISRLLAHPALRARYLAHVRTLATDWLDWQRLAPIVESLRVLIDDHVRADTRKLTSHEAFEQSVEGNAAGAEGDADRAAEPEPEPGRRRRGRGTPALRAFVEERRAYLLGHAAVSAPAPVIESVALTGPPRPAPSTAVTVVARVTGGHDPDGVLLYYSIGRHQRFQRTAMQATGDGAFAGTIPGLPPGTSVHYYVEARAPELTATTFRPAMAEFDALSYSVAPGGDGPKLAINEIMTSNRSAAADPQGEYDDWIELHNYGGTPIDLTGMYISDDLGNPAKYRFPAGTTIDAGGYLVLWADRDVDDPGHHLSFRLARTGGVVRLADRDDRNNTLIDLIEYGRMRTDVALRRVPDGIGVLVEGAGTPGRAN